MILYINACVREKSRTRRIAEYLFSKMNDMIEEVRTAELQLPETDQAFLTNRDRLIAERKFDAPCFDLARQFAGADTIVIAAPYWDLSFPASLKKYFEHINVIDVTFGYSSEGVPLSLCRAKKLFYITTAGGKIVSDEYGFGYVKALSDRFYMIPEIMQIKAEGLDIQGADAESIVLDAEKEIDRLYSKLDNALSD